MLEQPLGTTSTTKTAEGPLDTHAALLGGRGPDLQETGSHLRPGSLGEVRHRRAEDPAKSRQVLRSPDRLWAGLQSASSPMKDRKDASPAAGSMSKYGRLKTSKLLGNIKKASSWSEAADLASSLLCEPPAHWTPPHPPSFSWRGLFSYVCFHSVTVLLLCSPPSSRSVLGKSRKASLSPWTEESFKKLR